MCKNHLYVNEQLVKDPSHTTMIQYAYQKDLLKRFTKLKAQIIQAIVKDDCFNLINKLSLIAASNQPSTNLKLQTNVKFNFTTTAEKVDAFMDWLQELVDAGILEVTKRDGHKIVARNAWQNTYVRSTYQKALEQGVARLEKAGVKTGLTEMTIAHAFYRPFHADKVGILYTRNFKALKGITDAMDTSISRILAEGLAKGEGPIKIARALNKEVDNIGVRRSKVLARTEVMNAHADATLNLFEDFGMKDVTVKAEWSTAGWNVCPLCAPRNGKVYTLETARGLIPFHPNCRCVWIPWIPEVSEKKASVGTLADEMEGAPRRIRKPRTQNIRRRSQYETDRDYVEAILGASAANERRPLLAALAKDIGVSVNEAEQIRLAIQAYTGEDYKLLRRACTKPSQASQGLLIQVKQIEDFIKKSAKYDGDIYRGIKMKPGAKTDKLIAGLQVGKKLNMKGISSWTSDREIAKRFMSGDEKNVLFKLPTSKKSAPIRHLSEYETESEVLMSKDARFIIKNVTIGKYAYYDDVVIVELEEL